MRKLLFATIAVCAMGFTACGSSSPVGDAAVDSTCQVIDTVSIDTVTVVELDSLQN